MAVRIEAGPITCNINGMYRRWIDVTDGEESIISRAIYATTREELEIIDHENFMMERSHRKVPDVPTSD